VNARHDVIAGVGDAHFLWRGLALGAGRAPGPEGDLGTLEIWGRPLRSRCRREEERDEQASAEASGVHAHWSRWRGTRQDTNIEAVRTWLMKSKLLAAVGAAMLVSAACARTPASADGCDEAIETVQRGHLAPPQDERAWSTLPGCGTHGGLAARDAWTSLRTVSDTARLAKAFEHLRTFRDSAVFGAARTVLLDSAATAPSRVYSAMLVVAQVRPRSEPDYHVFSTTGGRDPCVAASVRDRPMRDGAPLGAQARREVDSAFFGVLADQSAPQSVRNAARCMYATTNGESSIAAGALPAPNVTGYVMESAGRIDAARSLVRDTTRRSARRASQARTNTPADSIRGRIGLGGAGGCVMQQAFLETSEGERFRLDVSRSSFRQLPGFRAGHHPFHQLSGLEVVVFGRESKPLTHPSYLPYPQFTVDSFFVRARQETRVYDGILARGARGDVLVTRDRRRLPVAGLPPALQQADGMRVWIGEPLGAPTIAGVMDPDFRVDCPE
jgi:hypothetical protein